MNTVFRKNLGFIFDACHVLICKTEKRENWINTFVQEGKAEKDLQEIDSILSKFDSPDPKLLLFGYKDRKKGSFLGNLLIDYADHTLGNFDLDDFLRFVTNSEEMKQRIAKFYFETETINNIFEVTLNHSSLSASLKGLIYEFYLFPEHYLTLLKDTFLNIFSTLNQHYSDNFELYLKCQETFDYTVLKQPTSPFARNQKWDRGIKTCYISFSLINKYLIVRGKVNELGWLVLGSDFFSTFGEVSDLPINIAAFGNALGDKLRIGIIKELAEHGEMTLADLARNLDVVNTIAIYHLDILKKENLLFHRNSGRKVLYCLNIRQIDKSLNAIKQLCGGVDE